MGDFAHDTDCEGLPPMAVPNHGEDPRSDHRANAQRGKGNGAERLFERVLRTLGVGNQLVNGLGGKDLSAQLGLLCQNFPARGVAGYDCGGGGRLPRLFASAWD